MTLLEQILSSLTQLQDLLGATQRERARKNTLSIVPESLDDKQLNEYDLIIAMEPHRKNVIISIYPGYEKKTVVWNIEDPYLLPHGHTMKIFKQIKDKVEELANSL